MSELACTEECGDTVSQLQDAALLLHTGGVQLLWQVWIWDCGDPDWTGFERWCGHHWPDCAKYVLCDLTEHCQEDLGHWTDSCGTVHKFPGEQLVLPKVGTAEITADLLVRSHWHTGCSGTDGTDHLQSWTGEVPYLVHCSWTEEQLDWHWRKNWSVHWLQQTVLGPLLDYWITPTGCSVEHCGVPHWIWDPTALHCQGTDGATADGTELQQDLWFALQRTGWPLHPHCESAGTDAWRCEHWMCLAALVHWWGTAKENWKQTGNCSWRNWHCQGRCEDHWTACWIWGSDCDYHWSLRLSIPTWSLRQLFLNTAMLTDALKSWKQVHWWASSATHLHTAPRLIDTVQLFTDCVFSLTCKYSRSLHACTGLWHWFTESMPRGSAKIHALYPHHCALQWHCQAYSLLGSRLKPGLSTWLKSLTKRLTESTLVWLELLTVSCTGERS